MNILRNILVVILVVVMIAFVNGCGIIHGIASDTEVGSRWIRNSLDSTMEKRANNRLVQAEREKQQRLERATAVVLENHEKASSSKNQ